MTKLYAALILLTLLAGEVQATTAKIYVWRDEKGMLVYSDTPRPGAEEVEVKQSQNISPSIDTSVLDITPKVIEEKYQVDITQPEAKATIRDNTGSVYIAGRIKPIFKQGLNIQLYLDNKPYQKPQPSAIFILRNVDRGEHQVKMDLLNDKGKVIASSKPVTFYLHRMSVNRAK